MLQDPPEDSVLDHYHKGAELGGQEHQVQHNLQAGQQEQLPSHECGEDCTDSKI